VRKLPPSSPSPRSRARTRSSSSLSRARGERVRHTDPAAASRRCALCTRTFPPRQSFAAPAGSARLAWISQTPSVLWRNILTALRPTHPLSLPQGPFSIRPRRGSNVTLCGLSTIPRTAAAAIKRRLLTRNGGWVRRHRKSLPVGVRGVGEVSVPDSEIGCPACNKLENSF
jgi:hypothetical protein